MAPTLADVQHSWLDGGSQHTTPEVKLTDSASDAHIGEIHTSDTIVDLVLTTDTNIYASGDVLSDQQALVNALRVSGGHALLQSVVVTDSDDQAGALDIVFLASGMSIGIENAAAAITGTILERVLGIVEVIDSDYVDVGGAQVVTKGYEDLGFIVTGNQWTKDVYVASISRDTKTYSADGLELRIGFSLRE